MPDFNPFDMDLDGDVDGIDFLWFDYFMRYGPGRADGSAQDRSNPSAPSLATVIGVVVLFATVVLACLVCILASYGAS